jgi:hypothetical protein
MKPRSDELARLFLFGEWKLSVPGQWYSVRAPDAF